MSRRRKTDKTSDTVVVTTTDGKIFRCSLDVIGRESQPRWMLLDSSGVQRTGPLAVADKTPAAVQQLISDWWAQQQQQ